MAKKKEIVAVEEKIIGSEVEFVLKDRFMRYAKYIIQERAIPDIRDGLKPVQRRILYAMSVERNEHNLPYRKSAKAVGNVIANYHPHGDSSVYDAMVRMSQSWKMRHPLIDMQGNNGSIDDDPAAAMRYTEARLSAISALLLKDIDKDSVKMALNFDDTTHEPTVLPSRVPNLLLNGSTGIAIGYATDIPPHNLQELIEGIIYRISNPKSTIEELMEIIKGPDFPTGGLVYGELLPIYTSGNGRTTIRSKVEVVSSKNSNQIVITEIPYGVVKSTLVARISDCANNLDSIVEVRDESGRENGLKIVIDLTVDGNADAVINYLYKHTPLQINYNYNMVAIENRRPKLFNLLDALDAFIAHQVDVYSRISIFDLAKAEKRLHIVEGLIKAVAVLDEIIAIIRSSIDKSSSKTNLEARFGFTEIQSEAIVTLQLYRLSRTDAVELEKEAESLRKTIIHLKSLLDDRKKMLRLISKELKEANEPFYQPRRTAIIKENAVVTINHEDLISKEEVMVAITRDGYVKRSNLKSYSQSTGLPQVKIGDNIVGIVSASTLDNLMIFFESGQYCLLPVHQLQENKWKEEGKHLGAYITISGQEKVISALAISKFREDIFIVQASRLGYIKKSRLSDFEIKRQSRPSRSMLLSSDDLLAGVSYLNGDSYIILATEHGYANKYHEGEVPLTGVKSGGVKAVSDVKRYGNVVSLLTDHRQSIEELLLVTAEGGAKIINYAGLSTSKRLNAPTMIYRTFKTEPHHLLGLAFTNTDQKLLALSSSQKTLELSFANQKAQAFDRILKASMTLEKNEKLLHISNLIIDKIDETTVSYQPSVVVKKKVTIEEVDDRPENLTIFDFIE